MQEAWVQSLVRGLGSHKPLGEAKKKKKKTRAEWIKEGNYYANAEGRGKEDFEIKA